jgi:hypothetical protein
MHVGLALSGRGQVRPVDAQAGKPYHEAMDGVERLPTITPETLWRLVSIVFPIMYAWLFIGLVVSLFYHLSLFFLDGDFRFRHERSVDVFISILRGLAYIAIWPAIFVFDRTALKRIWLFLLWLDPEQRESHEDLKQALRAREYQTWSRRHYFAKAEIEERRRHELETGEELARRLQVLHEDNPELDRIWMLTGVGSNPMGAHELVRLYPNYHLPDEVEDDTRREVQLRRDWTCEGCGTRVPALDVRIPGVSFLRVLNHQGERVVEGWAISGSWSMKLDRCPECDAEQPELEGNLSEFGRASDVVKAVQAGLTFHLDLA